ncbi:unnamed protein product [Heterobilharzia americana]|nr:unnamed protein product [Heterobilharzia americana]
MATEFTDEVVHGITCESKSSRDKSFAEAQMQSEPYKIYHRGTQSKRYRSQEIQTDWFHQDKLLHNTDIDTVECNTETKLIYFLTKIEPIITRELEKNINCKAFQRLKFKRLFNKVNATEKYTFTLDEANENRLSVTGLSWNSTGALLAIAYGSLCHLDWCTHLGYAALWNMTSDPVTFNHPKHKYITNNCLMCIKFHPTIQSLLAGGTYTGDLVIWDLAHGSDHMLANITGRKTGHKDCINQIGWITNCLQSHVHNLNTLNNIHSTNCRLLTAGSDGRIICWQIDLYRSQMVNCVKIFQIRNKDQTSLPIYSYSSSLRNSAYFRSTLSESNSEKPVNITCLSLSKSDPDKFVVGTEIGGLLVCEIDSVNWDASNQEVVDECMPSPVKFSLARHNGPIYSVDWNAFYPNLILVCGLNQGVQLFSVLQNSPLINIDPGEGSVLIAKFSPYLSNIFICITECNSILIYDLIGDGTVVSVITMQNNIHTEKEYNFQPVLLYSLTSQGHNEDQGAIISAELNHRDSRLLATGSTNGNTYIWDLGTLIKELSPKVTI